MTEQILMQAPEGLEIAKTKSGEGHTVVLKGRHIGTIKETAFFKPFSPIFREKNSIGMELKVLEYLRMVGVRSIHLRLEENGVESWFRVRLADFLVPDFQQSYAGEVQNHVFLENLKKINESRWWIDRSDEA